MQRRPNLFIIGAPKCGTHALYYYLKSHPEIFMSDYKAPHFFDRDILMESDYFLSEEQYSDLFAASKDSKYRGESNGWNLVSKVAAKQISSYSNNPKFILMLRNPFDAITSMFQYNRMWLVENQNTLYDALLLEENRLDGKSVPKHCKHIQRLIYTEIYNYKEHIPRYINEFGVENIKIFLHDDLKAKKDRAFDEVWPFLDLKPPSNPDMGIKNPTFTNRSNTIQELILFPPAWISPLLITSKGRRTIFYKVINRLNSKAFKKEPLSNKERTFLLPKIKPNVEYLEELLDRDLSHWLTFR